jgi:hypothetical protein
MGVELGLPYVQQNKYNRYLQSSTYDAIQPTLPPTLENNQSIKERECVRKPFDLQERNYRKARNAQVDEL